MFGWIVVTQAFIPLGVLSKPAYPCLSTRSSLKAPRIQIYEEFALRLLDRLNREKVSVLLDFACDNSARTDCTCSISPNWINIKH